MAVRFDDQRLGTGYRRRNFTMEKEKKKINETLLSLSLNAHRRWKFSYYGRSRDADKRPSPALPVVSHFRLDDAQNSEI